MKNISIHTQTILATLFICLGLYSNTIAQSANVPPSKIEVLNFGTFHMGFTPDANTTEFNEHDKENQRAVHKISEQLASFKPTVIIIETSPQYNTEIQEEYENYIQNPKMKFDHPSEIELLAYELGRISGAKRIYGIDHKMGYDYNIGRKINNAIDSTMYNAYDKEYEKFYPQINFDENSMTLLEKLKETNKDEYLDFLITVNADILTHAGTDGNFEGADEATKYYQRNLRMYSNLNRIELSEDDRIFILMGASHTAFFRDFMSRSPKYKMVNTFDYLE